MYRCIISKLVKKFTQYGTLADKTIPCRKSKVLCEHLDFINAKMEENDELQSWTKRVENIINGLFRALCSQYRTLLAIPLLLTTNVDKPSFDMLCFVDQQ